MWSCGSLNLNVTATEDWQQEPEKASSQEVETPVSCIGEESCGSSQQVAQNL